MIVHLFEDQRFVDITIENFESVSKGQNRYVVFSNNKKLKYLSCRNDVVILPNSSYRVDLDLIYKDCQFLIIHFLSPIKLYILKHKPCNVQVMWSVWGSDAYDHFNDQNFFEPLTKNIRKRSLYQFSKQFWIYTFYHFIMYRVLPVKKELKLLKKINYISTVLPCEFKAIRDEFDLDVEYVDYNYGVNKFTDFQDVKLGNSILIGNSATSSNNHLDIFEIIKSTSKKLVVPLSYGAYDFKNYKEKIILEGKKIFKNNFIPITSYLSIHEYNNLLLSCNTTIMYHIRQQALGNIFSSLYVGMRVFLNSKSLTYIFLKDEGVIIFDLKKDYKLLGIELNEDEKQINRDIVLKLRSRKVIRDKTQGIIDLYNSSLININQ